MNQKFRWMAAAMTALGVATAAPYKDAKGFAVTPPAGWTVTKDVPGVTVAFLGPRAGGFTTNANVIVQDVPGSVDLATYTNVSLEQLETLITNYKLVSRSKTTLGGAPAQRLQFQGLQGKQNLYFDQVYTVRRGRAYVVTVTVPLAQSKTVSPIMSQFLKTFTITR